MQFWKSRREKVATCEPAAFTARFVIFNAAGSTRRGRVVEAGLFPELLAVLGKVRVNGKGVRNLELVIVLRVFQNMRDRRS